MQQGNPTCSYLYSFNNKDWKDYSYSAMCVPSDVCAVDVAGATKGLTVGYSMVLKILNRHLGDLEYAGKGDLGSCYHGMNMVNLGNTTFKTEEKQFVEMVKGFKIPIGPKKTYNFGGMKKLGLVELMKKCEPTPSNGVLYVFKNMYWSKEGKALNITNFDMALAKKKAAKKQKEEEAAKKQELSVKNLGKTGKPQKATVDSTLSEKMSQVTAIAEVATAETAEVPKSKQLKVALQGINAAKENIEKESKAASNLQGMNAAEAGTLLNKAAAPGVLNGIVDKTLGDFNQGKLTKKTGASSGLTVPTSPKMAEAEKKLEETQERYFAKTPTDEQSATSLELPALTADSPQIKAVKAKWEATKAHLAAAQTPEAPTVAVVTAAPQPPPKLHADNPKLQGAIARLKKAEESLKTAKAKTPSTEKVPQDPEALLPVPKKEIEAKVKEAQAKLDATEARLKFKQDEGDDFMGMGVAPQSPIQPMQRAPSSADAKLKAAKEKLLKAQQEYSSIAASVMNDPAPAPAAPAAPAPAAAAPAPAAPAPAAAAPAAPEPPAARQALGEAPQYFEEPRWFLSFLKLFCFLLFNKFFMALWDFWPFGYFPKGLKWGMTCTVGCLEGSLGAKPRNEEVEADREIKAAEMMAEERIQARRLDSIHLWEAARPGQKRFIMHFFVVCCC